MGTDPIHVVAIGGNALIDPARPPTVKNQFAVTARSMEPVADLLRDGVRLVLTHGNGPQVGFMARRSTLSSEHIHEVPLDSLVADTQGCLGYMIERALREALRRRGIQRQVVTLVTEVETDPEDAAFGHPTKPIGAFYSQSEANTLQTERGWDMIHVLQRGWRRVVPSPAPLRILQIDVIRLLLDQGIVVVCCGGGGIPLKRMEDGELVGVEGVVDKDRISALLGFRLGAERLLLATATDAVYRDFGTDAAEALTDLTVSEARGLASSGQFPPGSMGPKIEAACRFVEHGGAEAVICHTDQLFKAFHGKSGTRIRLTHANPENA